MVLANMTYLYLQGSRGLAGRNVPAPTRARLSLRPPVMFPHVWLKVVGGLMLLPALYLIQRATMENTYLSTLVRIQDDRGQR